MSRRLVNFLWRKLTRCDGAAAPLALPVGELARRKARLRGDSPVIISDYYQSLLLGGPLRRPLRAATSPIGRCMGVYV